MFRTISTVLFLLIGLGTYIYGQPYSGPAQGSVPSGQIVSTDNFSRVTSIGNPEKHIGNKESEFEITQNIGPVDFGFPTPKEGSNYYEDPAFKGMGVNETVLLRDFPGIPDQGQFIPPDPYCAVGPNNFVAVVNSRFRIWDKEGNVLKTIEIDNWFNSVFPAAGAFDPKVTYDEIDQRWIMVWLQVNTNAQTANLLLSVSDDSDPIGTWYNWALPANLNGTTNFGSWTDYQGVGYDENAIYIACNQVTWAGYTQGEKIRIIPKAQLYANTAGEVIWNDLWSIGAPPGGSGIPWHLRPAIMHSSSSKFYFLYAPNPYPPNYVNYFALYSITDPLDSCNLSGALVPVTQYYPAPNAGQLGGGMLLETGSSSGQNEPKYRDGYLYFVHGVRNPVNTSYSSVHFVKINVNTNTADQDFVFGNTGYWYFYPSVDVDKDDNVGITFSRSGTDEYVGAYFTTRLADDPAGFNASSTLRPGETHYVKDFGSGRNRWGDYNGILVDPVDQSNFWMFTEYAASPENTWGTWTGVMRAGLYSGPHIFTLNSSLNFGSTEVDSISESKSLTFINFGTEDVNITSIPDSVGPFQVVNNPGTITIAPYDSLTLSIQFAPTSPGYFDETFNVESNDPDFQGVELTGTGYIINPVIANTMYASTGIASEGKLLKVNILTGEADSIGSSNYDDVDFISKITVNPSNDDLYGLLLDDVGSELLRVNATGGDAYILYTLNLPNLADAVFDTSGNMYAVQTNGKIYSVDLSNGTTTSVADAGVNINAIAFDPTNNDLYGTARVTFGGNKDRIYKLDLVNGGYTVIGNTGTGVTNNDIEFDADGNMYGIIGASTQEGTFISIDKTTGIGTEIGPMGYTEVTGLAYARTGVTGVKEPGNNYKLPTDFSLKQNYPNPFNPSTTIEYSLPVTSNVTVTIYNLLGEVVKTLVDGQQNAGFHNVSWNSNDSHGSKVGSGVYFYEIKADGSNGSKFTQIRKMILLK